MGHRLIERTDINTAQPTLTLVAVNLPYRFKREQILSLKFTGLEGGDVQVQFFRWSYNDILEIAGSTFTPSEERQKIQLVGSGPLAAHDVNIDVLCTSLEVGATAIWVLDYNYGFQDP